MYEQILSHLRTKEEVQKIQEELEILISSLYQNEGFGFESSLKANVPLWLAEIFERELAAGVDKEKYLKDLKAQLENLRYLNLTLAFEPTQLSLDKIASFVKKNLGADVVIDINFDPSILAGAIIIWQGKWRDFSLRRLFDEEIETKKEEIIQLLKN